jgi:hypothetical protein
VGVLERIRPARTQAKDLGVILDLDDLLTKPNGFRVHGKLYKVNAVDTQTFMRLAEILGEVQTLIRELGTRDVSENEIYEKYHEYISVLCPEFTMEALRKMQLPQVHGLINLIIKQATGQPMNLDDFSPEKKKTSRLTG